MHRTRVKAIPISPGQERSGLSQGQKTFNKLLKQIETKRALLAAWEDAVPVFQNRFSAELLPLVEATTALQVQLVHALDQASGWKGLTKTERRELAELTADLAGDLISQRDDPALKAIYNKHSQSDYDLEEAEEMAAMKAVLEETLGVELGDDVDLNSPDDVMQRAQAHLREKTAREEAERQAKAERRAARKKTPKQLAREAEQESQKQQIGLSIREIYRKLASALHPDREPDPEERSRKTVLMQRVNQAYEKNNLLQLLELQLELEHIDQSAIANIGEERLRHYNIILKEQVAELEQELNGVEGRFRDQFGISPFTSVAPGNLERLLKNDLAATRQHIRELEADVFACAEVKTLKSWLRAIRKRAAFDDFDFDFGP